MRDLISISKAADVIDKRLGKDLESMDKKEIEKLISEVTKKMHQAAAELNFELAAQLRDEMVELKKHLAELEN